MNIWSIVISLAIRIWDRLKPTPKEEQSFGEKFFEDYKDSMSEEKINSIQEDFDKFYEDLLSAEEDLKDIMTRYATGDKHVNMLNVDDGFKEIKKNLREIRQLALSAEAESNTEKGD